MKKGMFLSIHNYEAGTVELFTLPEDQSLVGDDMEEYITEVLGFNLNSIEWCTPTELVDHRN